MKGLKPDLCCDAICINCLWMTFMRENNSYLVKLNVDFENNKYCRTDHGDPVKQINSMSNGA